MLSCDLEGCSIVLVGNFNPAIFHPAWLVAQDIIRPSEGKAAEDVLGTGEGKKSEVNLQVVSPQVTSFAVEWLTLQVTQERFSASTVDAAHFEILRDLVVKTFTILEHTPVKQMGINRDMHYRMPDKAIWHLVGNTLAPKDKWESLVENPGLEALVIRGTRRDSKAKFFKVTVQPSIRIVDGVYIQTNEHFDANGDDSTERLMNILREDWDNAQRYAKNLAETLLERIVHEEP